MSGWLKFALIQLIALVVMVVGWFLLLPLAWFRAWTPRYSLHYPERIVDVWRGGQLTWIWGNEEDGVTGAAFYRAQFKDARVCAYLWSAWRNSANNLRWVFADKGGPFYRIERWGWYFQAGFRPDTGWPVLSAGRI
jgi:hypothetical protein